MAGNVAIEAAPARAGWLTRFRPKGKTEFVGYLFILPYLIAFVLFMLIPTFWGFYISLTSWGGLSAPRFVGLNNYAEALRNDSFWQSVRNTLYYTVLLVPALTVVGLAAAVFVNQKLTGFALSRVFFYSPYVMAVTVTGLLWMWILDKNVGVFNYYLGQLIPYFQTNKIGWLITTEWAMPSIAFTTIWWLVGFQMVILLAGLQDIPSELYEASKIDGAGAWQRLLEHHAAAAAADARLRHHHQRHRLAARLRPDVPDDRRRPGRRHQLGRALHLPERLPGLPLRLLGRRLLPALPCHPGHHADPTAHRALAGAVLSESSVHQGIDGARH